MESTFYICGNIEICLLQVILHHMVSNIMGCLHARSQDWHVELLESNLGSQISQEAWNGMSTVQKSSATMVQPFNTKSFPPAQIKSRVGKGLWIVTTLSNVGVMGPETVVSSVQYTQHQDLLILFQFCLSFFFR